MDKKEKNSNKINLNRPILSISFMSESLNLSKNKLRTYDKNGLLTAKRNKRNFRLYSLNDFNKGKVINFFVKKLKLKTVQAKYLLKLLEKLNISMEDAEKAAGKLILECELK